MKNLKHKKALEICYEGDLKEDISILNKAEYIQEEDEFLCPKWIKNYFEFPAVLLISIILRLAIKENFFISQLTPYVL